MEAVQKTKSTDHSRHAQIRPIERDDAERFYLATIAKDATLQTDEQRAAAHPPYVELTKSQSQKFIGYLSERVLTHTLIFARTRRGFRARPEADDAEQAHQSVTAQPASRAATLDPALKVADTTLLSLSPDLRVELPPSLAFGDGVTPTVAVLPTLRTMLLRSHIAKLAGRPVPKTKYKLIALLTPTADDVQISGSVAPAPTGKALEVEIPPAEEGRELGYWGLGDGDGVKVVEV